MSITNTNPVAERSRDQHVDVMLFWGIVFVVMGHNYQPQGVFFPAYTFHMAFFFFISGYLFKIKTGFLEKTRFVRHKFMSQVIPYFLFNSLFFVAAYTLRPFGINLTGDFSLFSFFIEPFISGHQNSFIIPSWFLLNLFIVNVIMQFMYIGDSRTYKTRILVLLILTAIIGMHYGLNKYTDVRLPIVRTTFAALFFQMGIMFRTYKDSVDKYLFNPTTIVVLYILVTLIANFYGKMDYSMVWGSLENKRFIAPLVSTALIIAIAYAITYHLSQAVTHDSLILSIGQNSFYIMAMHLFLFFLVNLAFYTAGWIEKDALSNIYYQHNISRTFLLYQLPAILIPTIVGLSIKRWKRTIKNHEKV